MYFTISSKTDADLFNLSRYLNFHVWTGINLLQPTYVYNTFKNLFQTVQPDPVEVQRVQENRRREIARKRAKQQLRTRSPDPVEGRKHMDVQTELYLEELSDRVEEADADCQTDAFLDRAPSPLFIPAKSGIDVDTQILEGEVRSHPCSAACNVPKIHKNSHVWYFTYLWHVESDTSSYQVLTSLNFFSCQNKKQA